MEQRQKGMYWGLVLGYVAIIYLTLPIMRGILSFIYKTIGRDMLIKIVFIVIIISVVMILFWFLKSKKFEVWRLIVVGGIVVLYLVGVFWLDIPEERVHFLEYGILGLLVYNGFEKRGIKIIFLSIFLVALFGAIDELIQWYLPNRVGDIRDIVMNAVSGAMGVCLGRVYWD